MTTPSETWIVVADGRQARVFVERSRLGPLTERADLAAHAAGGARPGPKHATVTGRFGHGRSASQDSDPTAIAEARFLKDFAIRIEAWAADGAFAGLVLVAPPTALGVLRSALGPKARARLELCDPHERTTETADILRERLSAARSAA